MSANELFLHSSYSLTVCTGAPPEVSSLNYNRFMTLFLVGTILRPKEQTKMQFNCSAQETTPS